MTFNLREELLAIARVLDDAELAHALCRSIAIAIHGCPRATEDLDILIEEKNREPALYLLQPSGTSDPIESVHSDLVPRVRVVVPELPRPSARDSCRSICCL